MMYDVLSRQMGGIMELANLYITGESGKQEWNDRKQRMADVWQEGTLQKQIGAL
jgi:hypothetical protein